MPARTKTRATSNSNSSSKSSSNRAEAESEQLTCDGCAASLTKKEALNCSVCKVWLHCYCAGVPRSRFADISTTFVCIPCSLSLGNSVVSELKSEIAALRVEIVELKTALDSANKKLEIASQWPIPSSTGEAGAEWTAVVKRNAKQQRRDHRRDRDPTTRPPSRSAQAFRFCWCNRY